MAYASGNPRTKKALKEAVASGKRVEVFSPGPFPVQKDGVLCVEGPHCPAPHAWYAKCQVKDGLIVKVLS